MSEAAAPDVVIVDFGVGRQAGGHGTMYLAAVERALDGLRATTVAPFRDGGHIGTRVRQYGGELGLLVRHLRTPARHGRVIVLHSPEFRDIWALWVASRFAVARGVGALVVLRRDSAGIIGRRNAKSRFLTFAMTQLLREGILYPASDSIIVLRHWQTIAGVDDGRIISMPTSAIPAHRERRSADGAVFGLLGRFRAEKGAHLYDDVIRVCLGSCPNASVIVQIPDGADGEDQALAAGLHARWQGADRVFFHRGHLSDVEYASALVRTSIAILPYDVQRYGGGTSGVMQDVLDAGGVVLATKFHWAVAAHAGHPRVVWLAGTGLDDFRRGIAEAIARNSAPLRDAPEEGTAAARDFARDWREAIAAAASHFRTRSEVAR